MDWFRVRTKRSIGATILSVAMVLTIFMPAVIFSSPKNLESTAADKTEDIFEGKFSPPDIAAVPDETFDVSFSISPTMDAPNTIIRFSMPADLIKLVGGDQVWMGDVEKGEAVTLTLSFATNGEVEAYVRANVEASVLGKKYRSSYYLHVATPKAEFARTNKGGSTTPDNSEIAISAALKPGAPREVVNPESPGTIRIKGRFTYVNEDGGSSPARYMLVWIRDDDLGEDDWVAYQWTNANGEFDITCDNDDGFLQDGRDPYAQLWAEGAWDWITTTSGGDTYFWNNPKCGDDVPDGFFYDYGSRHPTSDNDALQAGDAVYAEAQWIRDRVTWERPTRVTIRWPSETWPHCHGDIIDLPDKLTAGWEHDTVQHEYGHSVMWTLYGNSWPPGCIGGTHWISMEFTLPDAWTEGWAQFMRCAVDNDVHNLDREGHDIEDNDWYNHQDTGDMDGEIIEGSVASILWDIHDPIDTADRDYMSWGFDEIFYVLQTQNPHDITDFWFDMIILWNDMDTCIGPLSTIFWHYGIDRDYYAPYDGSISINAGASYTGSASVTLTLSCKDWGSGVTYMRFSNDVGASWSGWYAYSTTMSWTLNPGDGWKWVDVQFRDGADHFTTALSIYDGIYLDTTPPTGSIIINNGNPTYTKSTSVTLYLAYSDNLGVGVVYYGNAGESWQGPFSPTATQAWTLPSGDGMKTVWYLIYDHAGNYYLVGDSIILDTTVPTGSIVINSGDPAYTESTSVTLYLTCSDGLAGVAVVYYRNEGESWQGPFSPTETLAWTLPSGDGAKTVYYLILDYAGNSYTCSDSIALDTVSPTGSIVINSGATYVNSRWVTLTLSATDAGSGVAYMRFADDYPTLTWSDWYPYATTFDFYIDSPGDGSKAVDVQFIDWAEHYTVAGGIYDAIILDTTSPTGSVTINSGDPAYTESTSVMLYLTYSDSLSGVAVVFYSNDGESWQGPFSPTATQAWTLPSGDGTKTVYYLIYDNAWNYYVCSDSIVLDTRPHDVAVVDVTTSRTVVGSGYTVQIDVTIENHGPFTESFNVTVYYGNSAITAEQWETFWSLGDVNRDGYINGTDQNLLGAAFFTEPGDLNWNPWADLNQDLRVDISDIAIFSYNYGLEIWTYAISGSVIGTLPVIDLAAGSTQTLTFTWGTSDMSYGNYVICGYAVPILGKGPPLGREVDRADNTFVDGTVTITIAGDIDGDHNVDYDDFIVLAGAYGSTIGQLAYSPEADIDGDGDVDYDDFIALAGHYGQQWP